jgi:hypothetical protein
VIELDESGTVADHDPSPIRLVEQHAMQGRALDHHQARSELLGILPAIDAADHRIGGIAELEALADHPGRLDLRRESELAEHPHPIGRHAEEPALVATGDRPSLVDPRLDPGFRQERSQRWTGDAGTDDEHSHAQQHASPMISFQ